MDAIVPAFRNNPATVMRQQRVRRRFASADGLHRSGQTAIPRSAAPRSPSVPDEGRSTAPDIEPIRGFAEESPAAVAVLAGPAHRVLYANPALCAAAGRPPEALHGLPVGEAFPQVRAADLVATLDRLRASGLSWTCRGQPLRLPPDEGEPRVWD